MSIYRAYDIRGIYGTEITEETAYDIGRAFGSTLEGSVAVGMDVRESSPTLSKCLIDGLKSTGLHVIDVGVVPTPVLYYAVHSLRTNGGVMLTASHNPPEYNGFKLVREGGMTLYGPEIQAIRAAVEEKTFRDGEGSSETRDITPEYIKYVKERINVAGKPKVVLDCANGTAGLVAPRLFREIGCEVVELYSEPDGSFPNHPADPTVDDNLTELISAVKSSGADMGFAFDGDSDRAGFVTEKGGIVRGDTALALFSRGILKQHPGASVIFEVKCSMAVAEDVEAHGGKPIMYRTGHSFIKKKIKEEQALIAGEMSGHFFFADDYPGYDDGIYASARMTQLISRSGKTFSELSDTVPHYQSTPEIRVAVPEEEKFQLVEDVKQEFQGMDGVEVITVDGVRVQTGDSWGLIRASNTSPKIILRFEGKTPEKLEEMKALFRPVFDRHPALKNQI